MDFMGTLRSLGLEDTIKNKRFERLAPHGSKELLKHIKIMVKENKKVLIDPDYDPDGYFSGLIVKNAFDKIGFNNYEINKH